MNTQLIQKTCKHPIIYIPEVTSTNDIAKDEIKKGAPSGTAILADYQTCGRGRMGNKWFASRGKDIILSIICRDVIYNVPTKEKLLNNLMLLGAKAVLETLKPLLPNEKITIKEPNDVLVNGKKIAGVLVETATKGSKLEYVILGIGINVNTMSFPKELKADATSLALIIGEDGIGREFIIADLLGRLIVRGL